jgi:hypothetical protein
VHLKLNLNILLVILNFCANWDIESRQIRNVGRSNDGESIGCISEWRYGT